MGKMTDEERLCYDCNVPNDLAVLRAELSTAKEKAEEQEKRIGELEKEKKDRPEIICLCGSSRFIEHFAILAWEFEKQGKIALGLHYLPPCYGAEKHLGKDVSSHLAEHEGVAEKMDELHLRKIDLADRVFVINVDGYIGASTTREIAYAKKTGKPVRYLESKEPIDKTN